MPPADSSLSELVVGIAKDTEQMVTRYVELTKLDVRRELDQTKRAIVGAAMSASLLGVAGLLLALAACRALTHLTGLPLAASYGIGGAVLVAVGSTLFMWSRNEAKDLGLPVVEEAKEDVKWIKEQS